MRIIYSICSWGIGHATRSLPVIRRLLEEDNDITIISHDRSLFLLQRELGNDIKYIDIPDYPILISEDAQQFIAKTFIYWPLFIRNMWNGFQRLDEILSKQSYDLIISDGRYDMYSRRIPSIFISHQMRIMNPFRIHMLEKGSELFNLFFFKRFKEVIVPDYRDDNFSGALSHNLDKIDEDRIHYVGILSDFKKRDLPRNIDYLISITGPEPQRSILEKKILSQINDLDGNIVLTRGKTEDENDTSSDNIKIYSYLSKEEREEILNRSKLIISRSGYSTIMDLAVIGGKALMIPTPGQVEQEYLARYHHNKGTCYTVDQNNIKLLEDIEEAEETKGFPGNCRVEETVENILDIIYSTSL